MKKIGLLIFIFLIFINASKLQAQNTQNSKKIKFAYPLLAAYKRTLQHKNELKKYCKKYNVNFDLVFAIAMYESGGHSDLISKAGARGLLQIMPETQKIMKTPNKIKAGIKYLHYLINLFPNRIDKVIVAYNGGPKAADSERLKMESLQYLQGVSLYLRILKQYRKVIEKQTSELEIYSVKKEDKSWIDISLKTNQPILELRLFNPFLTVYGFRKNSKIVYSKKQINFKDFQVDTENDKITVKYKAKLGEIYHYLVNIFAADINDFRYDNGLWHNSQLFIAEKIQIGIPIKTITTHTIKENETISSIAKKYKISEWEIILTNALFDQKLETGKEIKIARFSTRIYEVKKGDTLYEIAKSYKIDYKNLAEYNNIKEPYIIYPGMKLYIPLK